MSDKVWTTVLVVSCVVVPHLLLVWIWSLERLGCWFWPAGLVCQ